MDSVNDPLNSNRIETKCENFKQLLLDDSKALKALQQAIEIFKESGIDTSKKRYKSETETETLIKAVKNYSSINFS